MVTYVETTLGALRLAKKVDMETVWVSFNLCHALKVGSARKIDEIRQEAAPHLFLVQISGAIKEGDGWADEPRDQLIRPLDSNEFDLVSYLATLADIGYTARICLMPYGISLPPRIHMSRSMKVWKRLRSRTLAQVTEGEQQ